MKGALALWGAFAQCKPERQRISALTDIIALTKTINNKQYFFSFPLLTLSFACCVIIIVIIIVIVIVVAVVVIVMIVMIVMIVVIVMIVMIVVIVVIVMIVMIVMIVIVVN